MAEVLNVALTLAGAFAFCVSVVSWISNLSPASSTADEIEGRKVVGWAWGIVIALALLKLMTMR